MSRAGDLIHQACQARRNSQKGAKESAQNSFDIWRAYVRFLQGVIALPRHVKEIPPAIFILYVHYELSRGIAVSTMKNRSTDIRVVSGRCGKNLDHFHNEFIGIPQRSLKGKKRKITDDEYNRALEQAARTDRGFELILRLQRLLGLRRREAAQCSESLSDWLAGLESGKRTVYVSRGAKNGRHRVVPVLAARREETIKVIRAALEYSRQLQPPRLLPNHGMKRLLNALAARYRRAGLTGAIASHALRYAYAMELAAERLFAGDSPEATLVVVSAALGHGPTRIHFTKNTYLNPVANLFVKIRRRRDVKESLPRLRHRSRKNSKTVRATHLTQIDGDAPMRHTSRRKNPKKKRGMNPF